MIELGKWILPRQIKAKHTPISAPFSSWFSHVFPLADWSLVALGDARLIKKVLCESPSRMSRSRLSDFNVCGL
mgnify:CR=1 FL=1